MLMKMEQVSDNCFAVLIEKNRVCDANSGLINRAGGVVIDTQSDLAHVAETVDPEVPIKQKGEPAEHFITEMFTTEAAQDEMAGLTEGKF